MLHTVAPSQVALFLPPGKHGFRFGGNLIDVWFRGCRPKEQQKKQKVEENEKKKKQKVEKNEKDEKKKKKTRLSL